MDETAASGRRFNERPGRTGLEIRGRNGGFGSRRRLGEETRRARLRGRLGTASEGVRGDDDGRPGEGERERERQSSSSRSQERLICIATERDGRGEKKASEQGEKEGEEGVLVEKEEERRREEGEEVEIQREREDDGGSWASVTQSAHRADYIFLAFLVWIARVSP
jgi:hypothetical protein